MRFFPLFVPFPPFYPSSGWASTPYLKQVFRCFLSSLPRLLPTPQSPPALQKQTGTPAVVLSFPVLFIDSLLKNALFFLDLLSPGPSQPFYGLKFCLRTLPNPCVTESQSRAPDPSFATPPSIGSPLVAVIPVFPLIVFRFPRPP